MDGSSMLPTHRVFDSSDDDERRQRKKDKKALKKIEKEKKKKLGSRLEEIQKDRMSDRRFQRYLERKDNEERRERSEERRGSRDRTRGSKEPEETKIVFGPKWDKEEPMGGEEKSVDKPRRSRDDDRPDRRRDRDDSRSEHRRDREDSSERRNYKKKDRRDRERDRDRRDSDEPSGKKSRRDRDDDSNAEPHHAWDTKKVRQHAEELKNRKLLWSKGEEESSGNVASSSVSHVEKNAGLWTSAIAAAGVDDSQAEKFKKLMGIKKNVPDAAASVNPDDKRLAEERQKQHQMYSDLNKQFESAREFGTFGKGRGLGFH